jgi:hypothetical protein
MPKDRLLHNHRSEYPISYILLIITSITLIGCEDLDRIHIPQNKGRCLVVMTLALNIRISDEHLSNCRLRKDSATYGYFGIFNFI